MKMQNEQPFHRKRSPSPYTGEAQVGESPPYEGVTSSPYTGEAQVGVSLTLRGCHFVTLHRGGKNGTNESPKIIVIFGVFAESRSLWDEVGVNAK